MPLNNDCCHIVHRIYFHGSNQEVKHIDSKKIIFIKVDEEYTYKGFCDDFGPMNLGTVYQFCKRVDQALASNDCPICVTSKTTVKSFTNAIFLIGSYMLLSLSLGVDSIRKRLDPLLKQTIPYTDASPGKPTFGLKIEDCWGGLVKAKQLAWVSLLPNGFDLEQYYHYDNPLNADLHEVVPGKFIAFRGPQETTDHHGQLCTDVRNSAGEFTHRVFSPMYFVDILQSFDVLAVVRLNRPKYNAQAFIGAGIAVADLAFESCTNPSPDVVARFLALAEAVPQALAVHCDGGLGRTGTLIALYMMKHHSFTAREAMGWLRIVRPGSVIGPQQQYLCDKQAIMHKAGEFFRSGRGKAQPLAIGCGAESIMEFVAETERRVHSAICRLSSSEPLRAVQHESWRSAAARTATGS